MKKLVQDMQQKSGRFLAVILVLSLASLFALLAVQQRTINPDGCQGKILEQVTEASKGQSAAIKPAPIVLPFSSDALHAKIHVEEVSNDVIVRIFNFNSSQTFNVLAEVPNMYNIAAHQIGLSKTERSLEFRLNLPSEVPANTSAFQVSVYATKNDARGLAWAPPDLIKPSPFFVAVPEKEPTSGALDARDRHPRLPACQSLPNLFPLEGTWHGPKSILSDSENVRMRTGWNFEPVQCNLEVFSQEELNTTTKPVTIAVLGSSVERGIFLSLVDLVTSGFEKTELADSKLQKCWGRAEISVGNIKLIYQDMRAGLMTVNAVEKIKCHGDKVAVESGMLQNGTAMIRKLLTDHKPNVIVSTSGCSDRRVPGCFSVLKQLIAHGAPTSLWDGIWVVADYMFNGLRSISSQEERLTHPIQLDHFWKMINDKRVRFVDTTSLASSMELYTERAGVIKGSQHFHRVCNQPGDNIRVCSNVTEAMAQLVLGMVIAPEGKSAAKSSNMSDSHISSLVQQRVIQSCFDCPASLLPFHILPAPNLTCEQGIGAAQKAGNPFFSFCPAHCMATAPTGEVQTQSGKVEERICMSKPSSPFPNQTKRSLQ